PVRVERPPLEKETPTEQQHTPAPRITGDAARLFAAGHTPRHAAEVEVLSEEDEQANCTPLGGHLDPQSGTVMEENPDMPVYVGALRAILAEFQVDMGKTVNAEVQKSMLIYTTTAAANHERPADNRPSLSLRPTNVWTRQTSEDVRRRLPANQALSYLPRRLPQRLVGKTSRGREKPHVEQVHDSESELSDTGSTPVMPDRPLPHPTYTHLSQARPGATRPTLQTRRRESSRREPTIHGDQQQARDCYLTTLSPEAWGSGEEKDTLGNKRKCGDTQSKSLKETLTISAAHMEERRPEPVGAHFTVVLNTDKPGRVVPIGIPPDDPMSAELVHLLREFEDIFAFNIEEMPGI
ncbi:hypothetical protein SOVF_100860, partial [Spinacia oleracea]